MVKKTQSREGKNPTFLAFLHPDWFLPYILQKKLDKVVELVGGGSVINEAHPV